MSADQSQPQSQPQPQPVDQDSQSQLQMDLQPPASSDSTSQNIPPSEENNANIHIASISEGGRELSKTILYIGNIHRSISDVALQELLTNLGNPIKSIKILQDKNKPGFNYAFVEYENPEFAEIALNSLNNLMLADNQLKVNRAYQTQTIKNNDTFNLFIGDLSLEVNDEMLSNVFTKYNSLVQANVMWDMKSGRSRGYGFVCFNDRNDAEDALQSMNGYVLGDRPIRLNWASHRDRNTNNSNNNNHSYNHYNHNHYNHNNHNNNHYNHNNYYNNNMNNMMNDINKNLNGNDNKTNENPNINGMINLSMINNDNNNQPPFNGSLVNNNSGVNPMNNNNGGKFHNINNIISMNQMDMHSNGQQSIRPPPQQQQPVMNGTISYEMVLRQTPSWLSVVYLGNLADFTSQNDLIPLLQNFGYIVNFKLLSDKNCAFVTYDTHERAALAIVQLSGFTINGRPLKCGWGKSSKNSGNMRNMPQVIRN